MFIYISDISDKKYKIVVVGMRAPDDADEAQDFKENSTPSFPSNIRFSRTSLLLGPQMTKLEEMRQASIASDKLLSRT